MSTSMELEREIAQLEQQIQPLQARLEMLRRFLREALSREFIRANRITADQVELSGGEDRPYFGCVSSFALWLKSQPAQKRWAEWNTRIYHTADLIAGRFPDDMPANITDIPQ